MCKVKGKNDVCVSINTQFYNPRACAHKRAKLRYIRGKEQFNLFKDQITFIYARLANTVVVVVVLYEILV